MINAKTIPIFKNLNKNIIPSNNPEISIENAILINTL
jgi:hypothetical protein